MGRILDIDLSRKEIKEKDFPDELIDDFVGQVGIGEKIYYDEVDGKIDALDEDNVMLFITGPFTGSSVQSPSNFQVISKNPMTGFNIAYANSHGFWGPRLKFAGYDGIVVRGKSEKPVFLHVNGGGAEIKDAEEFWGMDTKDTEDAIKKEIGEEKASVACIGPAGENMIPGACIENDKGHIAAKGNIGMIMGSKNLKAVAVHGNKDIPVHDEEKFKELAKEWREKSTESPIGQAVNSYGTASFTGQIHEMGDLPVKNFTTGVFEEYEKLTGRYIRETFDTKLRTCYGCSINHVHEVEVTEGPYEGFVSEEPEYEDFSNLGSNLGISDPGKVVWLTDYVDRQGLDGNLAGAMVSMVMEAYDRDILTEDDLGFTAEWGDEEASKKIIELLINKEGIGETLSQGLKDAAEELGHPELAVHFKGESNHAHDSRALWGQFLGLVVSSSGPNWEILGLDLMPDSDLGIEEPVDRFDPEKKPKSARLSQMKKLFMETLGTCWFGSEVGLDLICESYEALTGLPLDKEKALKVGERIANLERSFNVLNGFKPEYDLDISPRLLEAPINGGAEGKTIEPYIEDMVKKYNELMDWDWQTGTPSKEKLEELGLDDIKADLY